jgi:putative GTP pyrophosphokinase
MVAPTPPDRPAEVPSIKRANKAGDRLRYAAEGRLEFAVDIDDEKSILAAWRSQFQLPMSSTTMTLRSAIRTVTGSCPPGMAVERFKREQQIIAKLVRSRTRLSKMEDIGGCRAVLPDLASVYAVRDRIENHARAVEIVTEDDYNQAPRPGGYRALHLHVVRSGVQVEVQLRTRRQQQWAEEVERWDSTTGHDVKHEVAPAQVLDGFRFAAELQAEHDRGRGNYIWATVVKDRARQLLQAWIDGESRSL